MTLIIFKLCDLAMKNKSHFLLYLNREKIYEEAII